MTVPLPAHPPRPDVAGGRANDAGPRAAGRGREAGRAGPRDADDDRARRDADDDRARRDADDDRAQRDADDDRAQQDADDDRPWETVYRPDRPLDVRRTLAPHRRGAYDPAWRSTPDGATWRAHRTADGPATTRIEVRRDGVHATAWGPGAEHAVAELPGLLGAGDDDAGFDPGLHPLVRDAHRRLPGLRIGRSGSVFAALVPAVIEQRVVGLDAKASWRRLVAQHGEHAPGPAPDGLRVPPPASVWAAVPVWDWRRAGVEGQRADTIARAAVVAHRLDEAVPLTEARRRLLTVRGIGPWTVAETTSRALGDADAVSVGDYHLAHLVGWALTGERTDDDGMLELLAPWRGHRQRVIRLLELTQAANAPRFGPRSPRARPLR